MTYGEIKNRKEYINASDVDVCVNGEEPIDEQLYPEELDNLQVVGMGHGANGSLLIDLVCENWDERYEDDWTGH